MPDAPVLLAGRYRLGESLGRGGMGQVLLARDETLQRDVAIKEIDQPLGTDGAAAARRTLREARAAARIGHPNVVQVYDVLQLDDRTWIVMEYVPSRSLREEIAEQGALDPYRVARVALDLLGALRTAHRLGVEHRDVKPANVLLADDGRVLLTDFGIAAVDDDGVISRSDILVGSPQFMAPERAQGNGSGPEADLWSLGATLYAAIEGRAPYERGSTMATLAALATEEPDPPLRAGPLRPLLDGLLRKNPADRITAEDAESLARAIITQLTGEPEPPAPGPRRTGGLAGFAASIPAAFRIPRPRSSGESSAGSEPASGETGSGAADDAAGLATAAGSRAASDAAGLGAAAGSGAGGDAAGLGAAAGSGAGGDAAGLEAAAGSGTGGDAGGTVEPAGAHGASGVGAADGDGVSAAAPDVADGTGEPMAGKTDASTGPESDARATAGTVDDVAAAAEAPAADEPVASDGDEPSGGAAIEPPGGGAAGGGKPDQDAAADGGPAAEGTTGDGDPERPAVPTGRGTVFVPGQRRSGVPDDESTAVTGTDRPNRRGLLIGVAALVAVLAAGTAWAVSSGPDEPEAKPQTGPSAAAQSAGAATPSNVPSAGAAQGPPASAPSTPDASPSATTGQNSGGRPPLPAGWKEYRDSTGFSVYVPDGWAKSQRGTIVYFRKDGKILGIDQTDDPRPDPVKDWRTQARNRVAGGDFVNYQEVGIKAVDYFRKAADWEFLHTRDGVRKHVNNRGTVVADDKAYGFYWETPESEWAASRADLQLIFDSFQPAR
jgi:hypothetical protein